MAWSFPTVALLMAVAGAPMALASETPFGFSGPEIFPLDHGIAHLHAADVNGDGLTDLVVANNARSKVMILLNQTGQPPAATPQNRKRTGRDLNELPPDARFKIESIASEKRISALVLADLNEDKTPDLAYYGEPKELVVHYNQGKQGWGLPKRWAIDNGQLTPNALTHGDLDNDGLTDLVLLTETHLLFLRQAKDHQLAEPEIIPFSGDVKSAQILDIDGDKRNDVLLVNWDNPQPFRFRLQESTGTLGPEIHFSMPIIRSYWADDLDHDSKTEVITIATQSGRAQIFNFSLKASEPIADGLLTGQFQVLPLSKTSKAQRGIAWADLNGDGLSDLLVAEPDSGQLSVYVQAADGALPLTKTFPCLTGVGEIAVRQNAPGTPPDLFLLSQEERQIGHTRYEPDGRIPFPKPLPTEGKPLAMAVGPLQPGDRPVLAAISEDDEGRLLWIQTSDSQTKTQRLSKQFKSNPSSVEFLDADQDGLMDLVVAIPYEKIKFLRQKKPLEFEEHDLAPPGGSVEQPWMSRADVDGDGKPELLLGQKNFVRAVVADSNAKSGPDSGAWTFRVKDQINGVSSQSRIIAAAPLAVGTNRIPWILLLDAERKVASLCRRDPKGVWEILRNAPLPYAEFLGAQPVALGATNAVSIAFLGLNAVAWQTFSGSAWTLTELDSYETPIRDGRLFDVVSGDLNGDGRNDLVFMETSKNYLDLVIFQPNGRLEQANSWPVFEERTFRGRRATDHGEPREALITDLTKDGKNDLAVIVHDRILVYPQE